METLRLRRFDQIGEKNTHPRNSNPFATSLASYDSTHKKYTPHQNGVAERKNRSLLDKARSMAFDSHLPAHLWAEAVSTANYLINRTATRANGGDTPYARFTGKKPSLSHLKVFGCQTYVLNTNPARKKWAPRFCECTFLGYDQNSRGFRNYHVHPGAYSYRKMLSLMKTPSLLKPPAQQLVHPMFLPRPRNLGLMIHCLLP